MKSHEYHVTLGDLAPLALLPLVLPLCFAAFMLAGVSILPQPKPTLDVDRTILLHQAEASRGGSTTGAEILLIGDSSCLMDVNARQLERLTGQRALNLATLSYVGLDDHARLLRNYITNHPAVKTIVLLLHPESLRLPGRPAYFHDVLDSYLAGRDHFVPAESKVLRLVGVPIFKARFLTRALPIPLPAEYGQHYGFNQNLWDYLTENNGSALDPHTYPTTPPSGNPEYRLAAQFEFASTNFLSLLPARTRLIVGITPSPSDYVYRNHAGNCRAMLDIWSNWLNVESKLTNLPFVLPPTHFATPTHLNQTGVSNYTKLLAQSLSNSIPNP